MNRKNQSLLTAKQQSLLIISAHADDHISCAGTVFKLQKEKRFDAYEIVLTNSELGQDYKNKKEIDVSVVAKTRARELTKASKFLGIKKSFQLNQPDLNLEYSQSLLFTVVKIIREVKPSVIFLHNEYDAHPDHKAAFQIGLTAIKIAAMGVKKETLGSAFRVPMVLCCEGMLPVKTQILVDVTSYAKKKLDLFRIYDSQANSKAINFEEGLMNVRGYHVRKNDSFSAEAFTLQEEFPVLFFEL